MPVKIHCPHPPAATLASCLEGALVSTGCAKSLLQRIARPLSVSRLGVLGVLRRGVPRQLPRLYRLGCCPSSHNLLRRTPDTN